jgi:rare lipoprotein A
MYGGTAAHKTLPMGTMLLVKNLANGKTATVRINDRGPFVDGRIIDLSYTTARKLGIYRRGTEKVQIIALCATEQEQKQEEKESYEDIIGALAEEDAKETGNNIGKRAGTGEQKKGGIPVLVAHSKKKEISPPTRSTGALCAVLRPDGKKQPVRQDFDKGNFYIQVGSFEEKTKARKLARVFAAQGHNIVIQEFAAAGTHLFRVLVFSSTSLKAAKRHKDKLKKQGYEHAFVIARDNPPKKRTKATGTTGRGRTGKGSKGAREKIAVK